MLEKRLFFIFYTLLDRYDAVIGEAYRKTITVIPVFCTTKGE